jgi:LAO/AO transport system kinase
LSALSSPNGASARVEWKRLAREITAIENGAPWSSPSSDASDPVQIVGITGPSGVGKSTLVAGLIAAYSDAGRRVAVIAVDPSSRSGGAVLGDRVRMLEVLAGRPGVFIRSVASRGGYGALASCTRRVARLLEGSAHFDVVLIETVGAGQGDLAIASVADTVVLVTVPGLGDSIQTIKGGLIELADVVVVNMADRPGSLETVRQHKVALGRTVPVLETIATNRHGVGELRQTLDAHWQVVHESGVFPEARGRTSAQEVTVIAQDWLAQCARACPDAIQVEMGVEACVAHLLEEAVRQWRR